MKPFDQYPASGRILLGRVSGANCRHEYGLRFMLKTGQTRCAYCGTKFDDSYQIWLSMVLDHVVPSSLCRRLGISSEWAEDYANRVLSCAACNTFRNRFTPKENPRPPRNPDEFFDLRDRVFAERKELIRESHEKEYAYFESKPWLA